MQTVATRWDEEQNNNSRRTRRTNQRSSRLEGMGRPGCDNPSYKIGDDTFGSSGNGGGDLDYSDDDDDDYDFGYDATL